MKTPPIPLNGKPCILLLTWDVEFLKTLNALLVPNMAYGKKRNLPDSLLINKTTTGY